MHIAAEGDFTTVRLSKSTQEGCKLALIGLGLASYTHLKRPKLCCVYIAVEGAFITIKLSNSTQDGC